VDRAEYHISLAPLSRYLPLNKPDVRISPGRVEDWRGGPRAPSHRHLPAGLPGAIGSDLLTSFLALAPPRLVRLA
jgi:hypothetical protein